MESLRQVSRTTENWIPEEELAVWANLRVEKRNDPNFGLTEDEIQDRAEFIRCYLLSEFEHLLRVPMQDARNDFFFHDCDVNNPEYSAFSTHDFQRTMRPFNRHGYAVKEILERVRDLALMHSSISRAEDRHEVYERYCALVEREFRARLSYLVRCHHRSDELKRRAALKARIAELNCRILECKEIWERLAPPENWDAERFKSGARLSRSGEHGGVYKGFGFGAKDAPVKTSGGGLNESQSS